MAEDSTRFPILEAEQFAQEKSWSEAINYIKNLGTLKNEWNNQRLNEVKKGKYIELFDAFGVYEQFRKDHWPREGAGSPYTKRFYITRALDYDNAIKE
jgi:hypothetical protein